MMEVTFIRRKSEEDTYDGVRAKGDSRRGEFE